MAKLVIEVPVFRLEVEGPATDEQSAWALVNDQFAEEVKQKALDKAHFVYAAYDKGE